MNTAVAEQARAPDSNEIPKPVGSDRGIGRHVQAGKAPAIDNPHPGVGHPAEGKPAELGNEEEHGRGGGRQGITLCHKGKNTLTVGFAAQADHLRHGDSLGACR